jgi:hypothetical protein
MEQVIFFFPVILPISLVGDSALEKGDVLYAFFFCKSFAELLIIMNSNINSPKSNKNYK